MKTLAQTKKLAKMSVERARAKLVAKLKLTKEFKALQEELAEFENNEKEGFLHVDEDGSLVRETEISLDDILCQDECGKLDVELGNQVLDSAAPDLQTYRASSNRGQEWTACVRYGEPCIVNVPPDRGCYAVYSTELKLKLNASDVKSEEHALMLVERAMRKEGVFGDVVRTGERDSSAYHLSIPEEVRNATDAQLSEMIAAAESEEE